MLFYIAQLQANGFHGNSIKDVCERLISERIKELTGVKFSLKKPDDIILISQIVGVVEDIFDVSIADMIGQSRLEKIACARHAAMYAAVQKRTFSIVKIGKYFKRDHSTVLHACAKIANHIKTDNTLFLKVNELLTRVNLKIGTQEEFDLNKKACDIPI